MTFSYGDTPESSPNYDKDAQQRADLRRRIQAGHPLHQPPLSPAQQPQLFDPGPPVDEPWLQTPEDWVNRGDVFFHGTDEPMFEDDVGPHLVSQGRSRVGEQDLHTGTYAAAAERRYTTSPGTDNRIVPLRHLAQPSTKLIADDGQPRLNVWGGADSEFYENQYEDKGSLSAVSEPRAVTSWADDVLEARRIGRNVGQVREQLAYANQDLSYYTPEDTGEVLTQGAMVTQASGAIGTTPEGPNYGNMKHADPEYVADFLDDARYRLHGVRLDETPSPYSRFGKPR